MSDSRGFLYVATGERHLGETLASLRSLRAVMPHASVLVFTDLPSAVPADLRADVRVLREPSHSFMDKIAPLLETPFERTVFLDTDTILCEPVDDLFDLLDRFELAVAHAPLRHDRPFLSPNCFVELNTGVMAYRPTSAVRTLIDRWRAVYEQEVAATGRKDSDQPAFRQAAWEVETSLYILPSEYNLRTVMPATTGRVRVRIVHGRDPDMLRIVREVNASRSLRVFVPRLRDLHPAGFRVLSPVGGAAFGLLGSVIAMWNGLEAGLRQAKRRLFGP